MNVLPVSHIYRWDLDKTYLATDFDRWQNLLKIAFEKPEQKVNVPGTAALLRALPQAAPEGTRVLIFFISGSPQQMRKVLEAKLALDGVTWQGLTLKPNLRNIARGRFRAVKEQVGYKLPLLLEGRTDILPEVGETLFGDDAESDAFIYSLYADFMSGRVEWDQVEQVMKACRVYPDALAQARAAQAHIQRADVVDRIFIHLDRRSSPDRFDGYHERVVPIYNYWQVAVCLHARGRLHAGGVAAVAASLLSDYDYNIPRLVNSTEDLLRRGHLPVRALSALAEELAVTEGVPPLLVESLGRQVASPPLATSYLESSMSLRDYPRLLAIDQAARKAAKLAAQTLRRFRDPPI